MKEFDFENKNFFDFECSQSYNDTRISISKQDLLMSLEDEINKLEDIIIQIQMQISQLLFSSQSDHTNVIDNLKIRILLKKFDTKFFEDEYYSKKFLMLYAKKSDKLEECIKLMDKHFELVKIHDKYVDIFEKCFNSRPPILPQMQ